MGTLHAVRAGRHGRWSVRLGRIHHRRGGASPSRQHWRRDGGSGRSRRRRCRPDRAPHRCHPEHQPEPQSAVQPDLRSGQRALLLHLRSDDGAAHHREDHVPRAQPAAHALRLLRGSDPADHGGRGLRQRGNGHSRQPARREDPAGLREPVPQPRLRPVQPAHRAATLHPGQQRGHGRRGLHRGLLRPEPHVGHGRAGRDDPGVGGHPVRACGPRSRQRPSRQRTPV